MRYITLNFTAQSSDHFASASAERTISMLRCLKTWLRSTMAEDRLTGLTLRASCTDITVTPDAVLDIVFHTSRRILNQIVRLLT